MEKGKARGLSSELELSKPKGCLEADAAGTREEQGNSRGEKMLKMMFGNDEDLSGEFCAEDASAQKMCLGFGW